MPLQTANQNEGNSSEHPTKFERHLNTAEQFVTNMKRSVQC